MSICTVPLRKHLQCANASNVQRRDTSSTAVTSVYQNTQDMQGYCLNELAGNSTEVEKKQKIKKLKNDIIANSAWHMGSE